MRDHEAGGHMGMVGLAQQLVGVVHLMRRNGEHAQAVALPVHGVLQPKQPVPFPKRHGLRLIDEQGRKVAPARRGRGNQKFRQLAPAVAARGACRGVTDAGGDAQRDPELVLIDVALGGTAPDVQGNAFCEPVFQNTLEMPLDAA